MNFPATALALLLCCSNAWALPGELVLLAPSNLPMPMADFVDGRLHAGIIKDIGDVLAARLRRKVVFVVVPGRRVPLMLAEGKADGVCMVKPGWIDGELNWTAPLIPTGGVVLARTDAPVIARLDELRGKRVGTVAGYRYRTMEAVLGKDFMRDDAPSGEPNLRKLVAGRTAYALMERSSAAYQVRHDKSHQLRMDITYENDMARCAFSQASKVPFGDIKVAIDGMIAERTVSRIMANYR
ncbi:MAG: transporter substrate-binding domain-containing protein [Telluria sp.]